MGCQHLLIIILLTQMKSFVAAAFAGVTMGALMEEMDFKFINYIAQHNKVYGSVEEYNFRQQVFMEKELFM